VVTTGEKRAGFSQTSNWLQPEYAGRTGDEDLGRLPDSCVVKYVRKPSQGIHAILQSPLLYSGGCFGEEKSTLLANLEECDKGVLSRWLTSREPHVHDELGPAQTQWSRVEKGWTNVF
jgi:hypothetical protein